MVGPIAERLASSKQMTIDEAKEKMKMTGKRAKELEEDITAKQENYQQFDQLMSVIFGWKQQDDGSRKLVSKHPSGKIMFPDKSEDTREIEPGMAYLCLVYEPEFNKEGEKARETFAKIICEESVPKIYILNNRVVTYAFRDKNDKMNRGAIFGNTFEERIVNIIKKYEKEGLPSAKIIYRRNQC